MGSRKKSEIALAELSDVRAGRGLLFYDGTSPPASPDIEPARLLPPAAMEDGAGCFAALCSPSQRHDER